MRLSSVWEKSGAVNELDVIEEQAVRLSDLLYKTSLVIPGLDAGGRDNGEYSCSATISSSSSHVTGASAVSLQSIFVEGKCMKISMLVSTCTRS